MILVFCNITTKNTHTHDTQQEKINNQQQQQIRVWATGKEIKRKRKNLIIYFRGGWKRKKKVPFLKYNWCTYL